MWTRGRNTGRRWVLATSLFLDVPRRLCAASVPGAGQALRELDYPERLQKMLLTPQREVHVELIITRDRWLRARSLLWCIPRAAARFVCAAWQTADPSARLCKGMQPVLMCSVTRTGMLVSGC